MSSILSLTYSRFLFAIEYNWNVIKSCDVLLAMISIKMF